MLQRLCLAAVAAVMVSVPAIAEEDTTELPETKPTIRKVEPAAPKEKPVETPAEAAAAIKAETPPPPAKPVPPRTEATAKPSKEAAAKEPKSSEQRKITVAATAPVDKPAAGDAMIFHDATGKTCIGGVNCPDYCSDPSRECSARMSYVIELDKPSYISTIQLNAHDNIGKSRRSKLILKVNGKTLDAEPVYRLGSSVTLKADVVGQVITIESAHQHKGFLRGGEEAMIWDVYVFGDGKVQ